MSPHRPSLANGYEVDRITVTDSRGRTVEVTKKPDGTYAFIQPGVRVEIDGIYRPVDRPGNNRFTDVKEGAWYYDAVRFVQERGLMNGVGNGGFAPNARLSRAKLAQILYNKEGRPDVNDLLAYPDVSDEAWCVGAVRWAASQGVMDGYNDGTFGANVPITRKQLAAVLWRYAGSPAATAEMPFTDVEEISTYALEAVRWAVENGVLNGYGDGRLNPRGQATRGQTAQMLKNYMERLENNT